MNFSTLAERAGLRRVCGEAVAAFDGVYVGDLLSRCMSRVQAGNLWITIMNNTNVIAVASLTEAAAVILAEDVTLIPEALAAAEAKGITVYATPLSAYEVCRCVSSAEDDPS